MSPAWGGGGAGRGEVGQGGVCRAPAEISSGVYAASPTRSST